MSDRLRAPRRYAKRPLRRRHKVENMFAKLNDWRRITTGYDRCASACMPELCIAATVIFRID